MPFIGRALFRVDLRAGGGARPCMSPDRAHGSISARAEEPRIGRRVLFRSISARAEEPHGWASDSNQLGVDLRAGGGAAGSEDSCRRSGSISTRVEEPSPRRVSRLDGSISARAEEPLRHDGNLGGVDLHAGGGARRPARCSGRPGSISARAEEPQR